MLRWRPLASWLSGAALVGALTVGAAAALYYAFLPSHIGPENSSPPPEAIGVMFGALLGSAVGVAVVVCLSRSIQIGLQAVVVAAGVGATGWLLLGDGGVGGRLADIVIAIVICGVGAATGVAVGIACLGLRRATDRRRTSAHKPR